MRHCGNIRAILQALIKNHLHHAQRQGPIRSRPYGDMPIRQRRCPRPVRINHNQPAAIPPCLLNKRPQVHIVPVDIRAPRQHQLCQPKILRRRPQLLAVDQLPRLTAGLTANRPLQLARAQPVKEPPVHRPEPQHANRPRVAVRKNRLRPKLVADLLEPRSNRIQRLVPAHPLKGLVLAPLHQRPLGHTGLSLQRIQNPLRRIHPVQVLGHLPAKKPLRHRMLRIARYLYRAPIRIHGHQHPARVRTIVRAHGMHNAKWGDVGCGGHRHIVSWTHMKCA